ncbi:unnamed protein product [Phyllotreta striolata]|uniref:Peptidase S1 domain-containing protein n=1 Tax=Phyllotreta striolata TaxID=444603 RepID=A0A9N9TXA2_PHYSR|nr:unnamed protein product [Phyllotreta striolata]
MVKCERVVNIFLILVASALGQLEEGDRCGRNGVCEFLTDCPQAISDLKKGILPTNVCGYKGIKSIICCENDTPRPIVTQRTPTPLIARRTNTPTSTPLYQRPNLCNTKPPGDLVRRIAAQQVPGDKAREMCKRYSQYAYESTPFGSTELKCPIKQTSYISNITVPSEGEFPHMIELGYITGNRTTWNCGGNLISPIFIVTTGHCIISTPRQGLVTFARGGITDINKRKHMQIRNIARTFLHPSINKFYNDIGLVEVDRPFDLNPYLRPACLYTQHDIPQKTILASSWDMIKFDNNKMLKITLDIFSTTECNTFYEPFINRKNSNVFKGIDDASMICAGTRTIRDSCIGISGYPLMLFHPVTESVKCMYDVIAITAFGASCSANTIIPTVYQRMSNYIEWIEKLVWPMY